MVQLEERAVSWGNRISKVLESGKRELVELQGWTLSKEQWEVRVGPGCGER